MAPRFPFSIWAMAAEIRIGTSGYHYGHWRGRLYPADLPTTAWLPYFAGEFDTVELNATFYKLPTEAAIAGWYRQVPEGFVFAAKGSRFLTHLKKLKDTGTGLERYFAKVLGLRDKLGPVLWQLPPGWNADPERLARFLRALPRDLRHTFEFRDISWYIPEVYDTLEAHGAALCLFHTAGFQPPLHLTAPFVYLRMHGPGGLYQGSYSDGQLSTWADRIAAWSGQVEAIYVYFNNDTQGFAVDNARTLRRLVAERLGTERPVSAKGPRSPLSSR